MELIDLLGSGPGVGHYRAILEADRAASVEATAGFLSDVRRAAPGNLDEAHRVRQLLDQFQEAGTRDEARLLLDVACGWGRPAGLCRRCWTWVIPSGIGSPAIPIAFACRSS